MTNQTVSETLQSIQDLYGADFHLALAQTAATMANPAHGDRLRKAMALILDSRVVAFEDRVY